MTVETPPEKQHDSDSDELDELTKHLSNVNQLAKTLQSFLKQLAELIVAKNWISLLLLFDAVLILFCFPGGILAKFIKTTFGTELPETYPIFFGLIVGVIFVTALVIAIRKIERKPPDLPDFTERKTIKGLRAFTKEDAEIFARLERERDLRECLASITNDTFRIGILMGESGVGKSSFLQAGIIPQLARSESSHRGVYIRFSNQEPIATVDRALAEELQLPVTATNSQNLLQIFSLAVTTANKPLIIIFDQFEQFFVHFKQKQDREPFINALKDWYCADNPLPIKVLISIREDLSGRLIELQKALGYFLSPYEVFRLEKFTPESATKILQVIAQAEEIPFDEKFMLELTRKELASKEDRLISPVDLQVLAQTIERQQNQLKAFKRTAFQKIGGIEGLMTRYLKSTLDARVIPRHREAATKVLVAITDFERNVRAGALTVEEIQQKTQGTLTLGEIVEAVTWLASGRVRLITAIEQDGKLHCELAHERLIPALREEARKELTRADMASQLLDRRVNEWLGNRKSNRYLFNWQELYSFQQQKPYLIWGANKIYKEELLQRSWSKLTRQLWALAMVLVLGLVGMGWWHTPWGQIQQVRWELAHFSQRVNDRYKGEAVLAFLKDRRFKQAQVITDSIKNSFYKALVWREIAETYGKLEDFPQATAFLERAFTAAETIDDSYRRAWILNAIAKTYGKLEDFPQAAAFLERTFTAAEPIDDSDHRASILEAISETISKLEDFPQAAAFLERAFTATNQIDDSSDRTRVLKAIAETIGKLEDFPQAVAFLERTFTAIDQIDDSNSKAEVLIAIAETYSKLENFPQATAFLERAFTTAETIDDSYRRASVVQATAETISKLENFPQATAFLERAFTTAETIDNSYHRAWVLEAIAEAYGKLEDLPQAATFLEQAFTAADQIDDSALKTWVLKSFVETIGKLEDFPQARVFLERAFTAAEPIDDFNSRARVLTAIAETHSKLEDFPQATVFLERAFTTAKQIDHSYNRAEILVAITQIQAKLSYWKKAHHTVFQCPTDECKVASLAHILTAWADKKNPVLVDNK